MTVPEAIETVQTTGSLEVVGDRIRYRVRLHGSVTARIEEALATLRSRKAEALALLREPRPLEAVLEGQAIELWLAGGDRLFIVADEEDAKLLEQEQGCVYTAEEVRHVIRIKDPEIVQEIHRWKRKFNARISGVQRDYEDMAR